MIKRKIKKGDSVQVIAGEHKGREGKILKILVEKNRAIVEGINLVKKHQKPSTNNPQGGILEQEAPLDLSNLALLDKNGKPTRVGFRMEGDKKVRYAKSTNEII